jgi:hypothetical protein
MSIMFGVDCKLYYCVAGAGGVPVWTELTAARDVKVTVDRGETDGSTRGGAGWKATLTGLKSVAIDFDLLYDSADAGVAAIMTAFLANNSIGLRTADGNPLSAGTRLFAADVRITKFDEGQPLDGVITVAVTAKPTYSATVPTYTTV